MAERSLLETMPQHFKRLALSVPPKEPTQRKGFSSTVLQNFLGVALITISLGIGRPVAAVTPSAEPFNLKQMQAGMCSDTIQGTPYNSISQTGLRTPSLWWVRDGIAAQPEYGRKLIDRWLACDTAQGQPDRVDFLVNQQLWSLLDYLERYELVSRLGSEASGKQYNLRIFNAQGDLLAAYTCDFGAANVASKGLASKAGDTKAQQPEPEQNLVCRLSLNSGDRGFRGKSNSDGSLPTTGGTLLR